MLIAWYLKGRFAAKLALTLTSQVKRGDKGDAVRDVQADLIQLGYLTIADFDGDFGPTTENAVKTFQQRQGLSADGRVGPETRRALGEALRALPPVTGAPVRTLTCTKRKCTVPLILGVYPVLRGPESIEWCAPTPDCTCCLFSSSARDDDNDIKEGTYSF